MNLSLSASIREYIPSMNPRVRTVSLHSPRLSGLLWCVGVPLCRTLEPDDYAAEAKLTSGAQTELDGQCNRWRTVLKEADWGDTHVRLCNVKEYSTSTTGRKSADLLFSCVPAPFGVDHLSESRQSTFTGHTFSFPPDGPLVCATQLKGSGFTIPFLFS